MLKGTRQRRNSGFLAGADQFRHASRLVRRHLVIPVFIVCVCVAVLPARADERMSDRLATQIELSKSQPRLALDTLEATLEDKELSPRERAQIYREIAVLYRNRGDIPQARASLSNMDALLERVKDPLIEASYLYVLGTLDAEQGRMASALQHFHRAYLRYQEQENPEGIMELGNAIAAAHQLSDNHRQARDYLERTLELARSHDNLAWETTALGNLAISVTELEGPEAGLAVEVQALELAKRLDNPRALAIRLSNICRLLEATGDLEEATIRCEEALLHLERLDLARFLAGTHLVRGDLYRRDGEMSAAEAQYEAGLKVARDRVPSVEPRLRERLAVLYADMDEHEAAVEHLTAVLELRDTLRERERTQMLNDLQSRFDLRLAENEIAMLQRESAWQTEQLRQRRWVSRAAISGLILALLLAATLYWAYRQRGRLQTTLSTRNLELEEALETIRELAARDPLTGLYNRRAFLEIAQHSIGHCRRLGQPMAVVVADIDQFKPLNDTHGHAVGDEVLCQVSGRLQEALRESDLLCRWGGEEFVFLYCNTTMDEAIRVTTRIRDALRRDPPDTTAGRLPVTLTFGVARLDNDFDTALQAADRALYLGKQSGRDRIESSGTQ